MAKQILFMDPMVLAILAGTKTVTRRVGRTWASVKPGDRLWVREAWRPMELPVELIDGILYRADNLFLPIASTPAAAEAWVVANDRRGGRTHRWRPSIHMPRWASRLELEVVSVEVQRPPLAHVVDDVEAAREGFANAGAFLAAWVGLHPSHEGPIYRVEFRRINDNIPSRFVVVPPCVDPAPEPTPTTVETT